MGCFGQGRGGKECNNWVHSVCKGFADASEEDIERLNFYCPDHNKRAKDMRRTITGKRKASIRTRGVRKR